MTRNARVEIYHLFDPGWATRSGVHFALFLNGISGQGDEEQIEEWMPKVMLMQILGCYAMTELGHGR